MRIVIDLQACQNASRHRGIGRYAMAVTRALVTLGPRHDYRIVLSDDFPGTILPLRAALGDILPQAHILVCAMPGASGSANPANAWRTRAAEIVRADFIDALAPDLLFVPSLFEGYHDAMVTSVERAAYPTAVTLFDFIPIEYPEQYLPDPAIRATYLRKLEAARRADLLLPISHYVAQEARRRLGGDPARIVTAPLGVEAHFRVPEPGEVDRAQLMQRYGIALPFVLNTSPLEYRKNIPGLLAGFAALPAPVRKAHQLVIVGGMDEKARRTIARMAAKAGLPADALVLTGFVPDEDLIALYSECALFVFPSISEGFGLPVLEAMACGAPVIGSATTSIPEVIGRSDLLFDPTEPAGMGAAMARVLEDTALRASLSAYGPQRAAGFTWDATASTMLAAFERTCAAHRSVAPPRPAPVGKGVAIVSDDDVDETALIALARTISLSFDIILVRDAPIGDESFAASTEVRDLDWFERHAPRFGHILYVAGAREAGRLDALSAVYPGIRCDIDGNDVGDRMAATVAALGAAHVPDPAEVFAGRLPDTVRDVRPSSDDLARIARAFAANEAISRAPAFFVDVASFSGKGIEDALRRRLADDGTGVLTDICITDGKFQVLIENTSPREPVRFRSGDCLIICEAGINPANVQPTTFDTARERGVTIGLVAIERAALPERNDAIVDEILRWGRQQMALTTSSGQNSEASSFPDDIDHPVRSGLTIKCLTL